MAGRFPFDASGRRPGQPPTAQQQQSHQQQQQLRAALGLPLDDLPPSFYSLQQHHAAAQQHHHHHQQQQAAAVAAAQAAAAQQQAAVQQRQQAEREFQLRQMLLQEQIYAQLQEHQLRTLGEHLHEYPELQQHYHTLLLSEQLQQRRDQEHAFLRHQQEQQAAAVQLRYQEELRRQQLLSQPSLSAAALHLSQHGQQSGAQQPAAAVAAALARSRDLVAARERENEILTSPAHSTAAAESSSISSLVAGATSQQLQQSTADNKATASRKRSSSRESEDLDAIIPLVKRRSNSLSTSGGGDSNSVRGSTTPSRTKKEGKKGRKEPSTSPVQPEAPLPSTGESLSGSGISKTDKGKDKLSRKEKAQTKAEAQAKVAAEKAQAKAEAQAKSATEKAQKASDKAAAKAGGKASKKPQTDQRGQQTKLQPKTKSTIKGQGTKMPPTNKTSQHSEAIHSNIFEGQASTHEYSGEASLFGDSSARPSFQNSNPALFDVLAAAAAARSSPAFTSSEDNPMQSPAAAFAAAASKMAAMIKTSSGGSPRSPSSASSQDSQGSPSHEAAYQHDEHVEEDSQFFPSFTREYANGGNTALLDTVAYAADMATPNIIRLGTVESLLAAAEDEDKVEEAACALTTFKTVSWSESSSSASSNGELDPDEELEAWNGQGFGLRVPDEPAESIITPVFKSLLPRLPEEPLFDERIVDVSQLKELPTQGEETAAGEAAKAKTMDGSGIAAVDADASQGGKMPKKISNILEYPYPVDTWWPSTTGMRRERRFNGETSDEDNFDDEEQFDNERQFRANAKKIHKRLSSDPEPGVLEKLPHCRIHRVRTKRKKNSTAPELVYCWQVTEIYPNDIMVNCSVCGTWRHASCGGHYKPYSARENTQEPFIAVCENCHEEKEFLKQHPKGAARVERQRIEQLRRGLATSAVMRHASFSKHGGTYKWPLGSVSATHIGGHTRSVHARHDKAEKQWTDMATRLGRGYGYRQKERVRIRTKELERLLVSVEDAEGYTDRHNMLLFLLRDTAREQPVGFQGHRRNIFDPAEDESVVNESQEKAQNILGSSSHSANGMMGLAVKTGSDTALGEVETKSQNEGMQDQEKESREEPTFCARNGCRKKHRFDSLFCSDACGVLALELDLLRTFQDASDIHPSVLRH